MRFTKYAYYLIFLGCFSFNAPAALAQQLDKIEVATIDQFPKVAPGESLPVSLKLLNMGGSGRVDVQIAYFVENSQKQVLSEESETVAVETTASFVKQIVIPPNLQAGNYFIVADMKYPDQKVPAVATIPFQIEYKYFGFFKDQILVLGGAILAGIFVILLAVYFMNKRRKIIVSQFEYKNAPKGQKPYFELISDIILTMRQHLGDKAIKIANTLEGLKVADSGEVMQLTKEPLEIITLLTIEYEKNIGFSGLNTSQKAINQRLSQTKDLETQITYQKTNQLLNNVGRYFLKK